MIPEPDYSDTEPEQQSIEASQQQYDHSDRDVIRMPGMAMGGTHSTDDSLGSRTTPLGEDGLIVPRKPVNPCLESAERKSLHRELLFNQKIGRNVLGQKSELQKALEKVKDDQKKKELEEERQTKRSALEKRLEEQANKIRMQDTESETIGNDLTPTEESEFLRVHARVCSQTLPVGSKS